MSVPTPGGLYREMLRIRRFEERCAELYTRELIRGFLHLSVGQEAVAVGVMRQLRPTDAVVSTYRDHGHALARGVPMPELMAEMLGRAEGVCRGHGGSMHVFHAPTRFYGGNAIVGAGLPMAVGLALADRMQGSDRITACLFGEGAMAEGEFHESINLAALWRLPVLFVCENNLYAMGTALERSESETNLAVKAAAYEVPAWGCDGMDVLAVAEAAGRAASLVRESGGPVFLEARTYRFRAHSMYDPERYRSHDEVARWMERDPLLVLGDRMRAEGLLDDATLRAWEGAVAVEVGRAVEYAGACSEESPERLLDDVVGALT